MSDTEDKDVQDVQAAGPVSHMQIFKTALNMSFPGMAGNLQHDRIVEELELRVENEAVKRAWENYQIILQLTRK